MILFLKMTSLRLQKKTGSAYLSILTINLSTGQIMSLMYPGYSLIHSITNRWFFYKTDGFLPKQFRPGMTELSACLEYALIMVSRITSLKAGLKRNSGFLKMLT